MFPSLSFLNRRRKNRLTFFGILSLCAWLGFVPSGPLHSQEIPAQPVAEASSPATAKPVLGASENHAQSDSYVLQANDLVHITVYGEDDLTTETRISKSGYITFPLIGAVQLSGKSVAAATAEIRARLDKDYIINPQVTLTLMEFAGQWVTVLGEVQKPGQVQIPPEGGLDLLGAIALAGGYTRVANPSNVIVRRVVDDRDVVLRVDAKRLSRDITVPQFMVQPGDRISVGESIW
jgi:protein involved in polysaccharide export with SLBB domain